MGGKDENYFLTLMQAIPLCHSSETSLIGLIKESGNTYFCWPRLNCREETETVSPLRAAKFYLQHKHSL
jgi:hypothetical protein